ncbi:unnamed protein product [Calypogeia fissa]
MSRPSSSASLPPYNRNDSAYALLSRRGSEYSQFGSRYIQVDDSGVYMSSLVVTVLVSAIAIIGILLFTLVITLSVMLGTCQGQPLSVSLVSPLKLGYACDSFILNAEVNNLQGWVVSKECEKTVAKYMRGHYFQDFAGAIAAAADYLTSLNLKGDGSEVVVMDIDETTLSNLPYYAKHSFGAETFNATLWNGWVDEAAGMPLLGSVGLFYQLKAANIGVVLLTGRDESQRNVTSANLISAGYKDWTALLLRSAEESTLTAQEFKSKRRLQLESEGYEILANIGDQWSDLLGDVPGNRTFKLPNPMYYIY